MSEIVSLESANLAYDARDYESTQARLGGRGKFTGCRECGGGFGMHGICREALAMMYYSQKYVCWHKEKGNDEYLFVVCGTCNPDKIIPDGFTELTAQNVLDWLDRDPMQPDYAAQAAWLQWADELEAASWYDAMLARKVAKHWRGTDSHPATLNALRQLQEKYPSSELIAALAQEPEA